MPVAITKSVYDTLPDEVKSQFEEVNGEYSHVSEGKAAALKKSLNDLNAKKEADKKAAELVIAEAEKNKAAEIAAAKAQALEEALKTNDADNIKSRYDEMLAHQKAQAEAEKAALLAEVDGYAQKNKQSALQAKLADYSKKLGVFDDSSKVFNRIVGSMIDIDPKTGAATYLDETGSATSLDEAGFINLLSNDPALSRIRAAQPTATGGLAQGSTNTSGGAGKKLSEMTATEESLFANQNPIEYQKLISEQ